jgi:hypothetical protein
MFGTMEEWNIGMVGSGIRLRMRYGFYCNDPVFQHSNIPVIHVVGNSVHD